MCNIENGMPPNMCVTNENYNYFFVGFFGDTHNLWFLKCVATRIKPKLWQNL